MADAICILSIHFMIAAPDHQKAERKCLNKEFAQAILMTFTHQGDGIAKKLCHDLGYSHSTYYNTICNKELVNEAYKHVNHNMKWSREHCDIAAEIIVKNTFLTLSEIVAEAVQQGCAQIYASILETYLEIILINSKRAAFIP
jgi:hypothetical protein